MGQSNSTANSATGEQECAVNNATGEQECAGNNLNEATGGEQEQPYDFRSDIPELKKILEEVRGLFEVLCEEKNIVGQAYEKCRQTALQPVVDFLEDLIEKARPPVVYLIGRSGHGKSSLINTLTNTSQAKVGHIAPTTPESMEYDIVFQGQDISWKIVDSRGIFESTTAAGASEVSATKQVEKDIQSYKPDIMLYVINCSEVRNLSADLEFISNMFNIMKRDFPVLPPVVVVLSKADAFYHPAQWPIENWTDKQSEMEKLLDYAAKDLLSSGNCDSLDPTAKYYGYKLKGCEPFLYVIPVATLQVEPAIIWNTDRLNEIIGGKLPLQAWLHYYKSQKRSKGMKALASKVVFRLSVLSAAVGAIPGPGVSVAFLLPLYIIMITLIAKLADRDFSTSHAREFLKTCNLWQGAVVGSGAAITASCLAVAEVFETVLFVGSLVSAPLTAAVTYGLGKSAIAYFFDNEIKAPQSYAKEWNPPKT